MQFQCTEKCLQDVIGDSRLCTVAESHLWGSGSAKRGHERYISATNERGRSVERSTLLIFRNGLFKPILMNFSKPTEAYG